MREYDIRIEYHFFPLHPETPAEGKSLEELFAGRNIDVAKSQAEMKQRAEKGGLGWGDVKKELLGRINDYFGPMRERRADYEKRPDDVRDILVAGAAHARELGRPVLEACREAAGLGTR